MSNTTSYRNALLQRKLLEAIHRMTDRPMRIMEVCGGQTNALVRYGIEEMLPSAVTMIHGPGCPVCVTAEETVRAAVELSLDSRVIFCTLGDMARVPTDSGSLLQARSRGADVRILYSPLDVLSIAEKNSRREVIFFAIGFETTTPLYALLMEQIEVRKIKNLSLLTALYTLPNTLSALMQDPDCQVDALLAAGHVCAVQGISEYEQLSRQWSIPITVTGFEPVDLLYGIYKTVDALHYHRIAVFNAYSRVVSPDGNAEARERVMHYFEPCNMLWRGLGNIDGSGLRLRDEYEQYDALRRFSIRTEIYRVVATHCLAGEIMKGKIQPSDCRFFGIECTPFHPVGASMVSSEGACAACYRLRSE